MHDLSAKKIIINVLLAGVIFNVFIVIGTWFYRVDRSPLSDRLIPDSFSLLKSIDSQGVITIIDAIDYAPETQIDEDYGEAVFEWSELETTLNIPVTVLSEGDYSIGLDYVSLNSTVKPIEIDLSVNGDSTSEFKNIQLRSYWTNKIENKVYDEYGNQVQPIEIRYPLWKTEVLRDQQFFTNGLVVHLNEGVNNLSFSLNQGHLRMGKVWVLENLPLPTYESYKASNPSSEEGIDFLSFEAENMFLRSTPNIRLTSVASPSVSPYAWDTNELNVVPENYFDESGYNLVYPFKVETSGWYDLTFKYQISELNKVSYANIYIDGQIPFSEFENYPFTSSGVWKNHTLEKADGTPLKVYFAEGVHSLTFELTSVLNGPLYENIQTIIEEMEYFSLDIMKLTGGSSDALREWDLTKFIPDVNDRLANWHSRLVTIKEEADRITTIDSNRTNDFTRRLEAAIAKLDIIIDDSNLLPQKMNLFTDGSTSAVADLSIALTEAKNQGISLDAWYIHPTETDLPVANQTCLAEYFATIQKINQPMRTVVTEDSDQVIDIWVYRSRYTLNAMQQFVNSRYVAEDGTQIRLFILPDEMKIALANAAGTQPDAAIGISGWQPFELGIKGAVTPLEDFPGFAETISEFAPGSLLHMMRDGHVYGLPETQDFYVTFYRTDIMEELQIPIPETYEEIIEILPQLQAYGMNYFLPLSVSSGLKAINNTAPFIYQHGGDLFTEDAFGTGIDSSASIEGITNMVELFTTYGLPVQVPNFYDEFRSGTMPIGVGSYGDYLKFTFAAPEIANRWDIALAPGVRQEDGTINRQYSGTGQSVAIFSKSSEDKQLRAWNFLQWWLSSETQKDFIFSLQNTYGDEYVWNTANLNAVEAMPFKPEHNDIIRDQWNSLLEIPKIPGGFAIERGISDVWNKAVLQGANIRVAINDMVLVIDREIHRKMVEYGYLAEDGSVIKPYILPTIEDVIALQQGGDPS